MKKFGLFVLGGIATIILLVNLGPIVLFALNTIILYYSFKRAIKLTHHLVK
ncbi:hypothetical protein KHA80_07125 [Anaerobacillus sp. HL2]|nr:hypothetical protein KHA80_07125 [Anaerobacillus sp. HL2]